MTAASPDAVAHVVQVALTPVFLLAGVAGLLNVFAQRLARVADRVDRMANAGGRDAELARLKHRTRVLDVAVALGGLAGIGTCGAGLMLFLGALTGRAAAGVLFALFAGALMSAVGALGCFVWETLLSSAAIRRDADREQR